MSDGGFLMSDSRVAASTKNKELRTKNFQNPCRDPAGFFVFSRSVLILFHPCPSVLKNTQIIYDNLQVSAPGGWRIP